MSNEPVIAYLSMEAGLEPRLPTVAGGLGFLAGDILKGSADMNLPVVGVTLRHHKGYFRQAIENGEQKEVLRRSNPFGALKPRKERVKVQIEGKDVAVGAEEYVIKNGGNGRVPVYFLDTRLDENEPLHREISENCYWNGKIVCDEEHKKHRLKQETVLGVGGVRLLEKLGHNVRKYHMNEGHTALAPVEVANKNNWDKEKIKRQFSFTTHTLVPAGHESFPIKMFQEVLGDYFPIEKVKEYGGEGNSINMTKLAMNLSSYQNGVSKRNAEAARGMFNKDIDYITNAVHLGTWTSGPYRGLFDEHFPGWEEDPEKLKDALRLPSDEVWKAHLENKYTLMDFIEDEKGIKFDRDKLTLAWPRRMTEYKRPTLLFTDRKHLKSVCSGKAQVIFAGKSHPRDDSGKYAIKKIHEVIKEIGDDVPIVFIENYGMETSPIIIAGSDVLLNTPRPPNEASGTSGMKALPNGVLNLTTRDGWICEELDNDGKIGRFFGREGASDSEDAQSLYEVLEKDIIPSFYGNREKWTEMQKHSISLASKYNTNRMLREYAEKAWN